MNCHSTRAVLDLFAEGRLTPKRAKAVEAHLAGCADCRAFAAPAAAPASAKPAPADFKARLAAALKTEKKASPPPAAVAPVELWPRDLSGVALAAAALVLVALGIGWSGVSSQRDFSGDELAAGRIP